MNSSVAINTEQASNPSWQGLVPAPVTGSMPLVQGATSATVTGLALPQIPTAVIFWLSVAQGDPNVATYPGDAIPTTDGFTVTFASGLSTGNYRLVWLIFFN